MPQISVSKHSQVGDDILFRVEVKERDVVTEHLVEVSHDYYIFWQKGK